MLRAPCAVILPDTVHRDTTPKDSGPRISISKRVHLCCTVLQRLEQGSPGYLRHTRDPSGNPAMPTFSPRTLEAQPGSLTQLPSRERHATVQATVASCHCVEAQRRQSSFGTSLQTISRFGNFTQVLAVAPFGLLFPRWFLPLRRTVCRFAQGQIFARHGDPVAHHGFFGPWRRNHLISDTSFEADQRHNLFQSLSQPTPTPTGLWGYCPSSSLPFPAPSIWTLASPSSRYPPPSLRSRLSFRQRHETGKPHRQQHQVIGLSVPCPLPTQRVSKEPIFPVLRGFQSKTAP